ENQDDFLSVAYKANPYYYRPKTAELSLYPPTSQPGGLSFLRGRGRVVTQNIYNERREFVVECNDSVQARIETYYYPHWVVQLDGHEIPINIESETGLMLVDLPEGTYKLTVAFEPRNQLEIWAYRISLLTWVLFIGWIIRLNILSTHKNYAYFLIASIFGNSPGSSFTSRLARCDISIRSVFQRMTIAPSPAMVGINVIAPAHNGTIATPFDVV